MQFLQFLVLALAIAVCKSAKTFPKELERCQENDATTLDCLKNAMIQALPLFVKGFPELGVMSIDPLEVTRMEIVNHGGGGPVSVHLTFTDEMIHGFADMSIEKVEGSTKLEDFHLMIDVKIPNFQLIGNYEMDGKVMLLPITGRGYSNLTLVNMVVKATLKGKPFEKKGEKHLEMTNFDLDIVPSRLHMQFDHLFNGDEALSNHMNNFVNENWNVIYNELKPSIEDTFGAIFLEISNRIYSRFPYKNIVL